MIKFIISQKIKILHFCIISVLLLFNVVQRVGIALKLQMPSCFEVIFLELNYRDIKPEKSEEKM